MNQGSHAQSDLYVKKIYKYTYIINFVIWREVAINSYLITIDAALIAKSWGDANVAGGFLKN